MKVRIAIAVLGALMIFAVPVLAADAQTPLLDKNTHLFQPVTDGSGMIVTYGSEPLGTLGISYGAYLDMAISPMRNATLPMEFHVDYDADLPADADENAKAAKEEQITLVTAQTSVNALFAIGFTDHINIGVAFPYVITRSYDENYDNVNTFANSLEDMRIDTKLLLLNRRRHCIGIGLINTLTIPLYNEDNFSSDYGLTVAPRFLFDIGRTWWTVAFNGGYKYYTRTSESLLYPDLEVSDELMFNLGVRFRLHYDQELVLDSAVRTLVAAPFANEYADYAEVMAAYRKYWVRMNHTCLTLGASAGLTQGVGTPLVRIFVGIGRDENRLRYLVQ